MVQRNIERIRGAPASMPGICGTAATAVASLARTARATALLDVAGADLAIERIVRKYLIVRNLRSVTEIDVFSQIHAADCAPECIDRGRLPTTVMIVGMPRLHQTQSTRQAFRAAQCRDSCH